MGLKGFGYAEETVKSSGKIEKLKVSAKVFFNSPLGKDAKIE